MATIAYSLAPEGLDALTRDGGDPLGFRAVANAIARDLVPGLTQATNLARGFSLLCLSLDLAAKAPAVDETYLRAQRLWILAATRLGPKGAPLAGVQAARRLLNQGGPVPLTEQLLVSELSSGIWGAYRRAALSLGLIARGSGGSRAQMPSAYRLTSLGRELAAATRREVVAGQPVRRLSAGQVSSAWLEGQRVTGRCTKDERQVLSNALSNFDARPESDGAHRRLYRAWRANKRELPLEKLAVHDWPEQHASAVMAARSVRRLIKAYEQPLRDAAVDGDGAVTEAVPDADWDAIVPWDRSGVSRLRAELRDSTDPIGVLFAAHRRRATELGREPWERGQTPEAQRSAAAPDFALSAAAALYRGGMVPRG